MDIAHNRLPRAHLVGLFTLALVLRVGQVLLAHFQGVTELYLDAEVMARTAQGLWAGESGPGHPFLLSPLYPYLIAPFQAFDALVGATDPLLGLRLFQAVLGSVTVILVTLLAARLAGKRAAWIAGLLAALHGPTIHYEGEILVAGPQALLLTLAFLLAETATGSPRPRQRWFGAGWVLGLASTLRPTALILLPILAVRAGRAKSGGSSPLKRVLLGACLAVLPFSAHNLFVGGEAVLLTASGGFNFWVGNHAGAPGVFEAPVGYDLATDPVARSLARDEEGTEPTYSQASARWRDRALEDMSADPLAALSLLGVKALLFLHPTEIPQLGPGFDLARERSWLLSWPLDSRWLLLLALCAPFVLRRSLPLWIGVGTYAAVVVLFFVAGRYRAPILPLAAVLAGISVDGIVSLLVAGRGRGQVLAGAILVLGGASIKVHGEYLAMNPGGGADMLARRKGLELLEQGDSAGAIQVLAEALAAGGNLSTRTVLGMAFADAGRFEEAAEQFRAVLAADSARPDAAFHLAGLLIGPLAGPDDIHKLASTKEAEDLYRSALRVRADWAEAHFNLGVALLRQLRFEQAILSVERALDLGDPEAAWRPEARKVLDIARSSKPTGGG